MGPTDPPASVWWVANAAVVVLLAVVVIAGAVMFFRSNVFQDSLNSDLPPDPGSDQQAGGDKDDRFAAVRREMVEEQLRGRDITDPRVLEAMGRVARERFVPAACDGTPTRTIRCRSGWVRRSRSRTSWR